MLHQYRVEKGIAEDTGMEPSRNADKSTVDNIEQHLRPPPAPGREARRSEVDVDLDTTKEPPATVVAPSCAGSSSAVKPGKTRQTSIRRWTENTAQKRLDMQWGKTLFRSGIPFNFVRVDETRALHDLYMELGAAKAKVDMPSFDTLRTVILDAVYEEVKTSVQPLIDQWGVSGCTLITDGTADRKWRPVLNFIGAGAGGAVLLKVVDMTHRKTNAAAIAKLWEEVIREIGVHRVNAICTDNAGVNKRAARILSRSADPNIAKIPRVPCAAHTLSLLLKDISKLSWVSKIVKRAKMMVKFIKNHHRTVALFSACSFEEKKTLVMPTEVRFASTFEMLNKLQDRRGVLEEMMERGWKNIHWSSTELREKADKIYHTVRSSQWWEEVYQIVLVMRPQEKEITRIVDDRCKMMRQPVHAANFLLSPTGREPRWVLDKNTPLVQNAIKHFLTQLGGERWGSQQNHVDVWQSLWAFHQKPPKELMHKEPMWDTFGVADSALERKTASEWWSAYGENHPDLKKIATRVIAMWSTATPCERNWSSLDLIHTKRRNNLSSASLAKLVYIHWNMQLQCIPKSLKDGFIDVWASFFDEQEAPSPEDDPILPGPLVEDEAELRRQANLRKTPKGRIPVGGGSDDSDTESSDEEIIWSGKPKKAMIPLPQSAKGKDVMEMESEDDEDVDEEYLDKDVECCSEEPQRCAGGGGSLDDVDRAAAKAMADRDRDLVQQRIQEEAARHESVPLRSRSGAQLPRPTTGVQQQEPVEQQPDHMGNQRRNELEQHSHEQLQSQVEQQQLTGRQQHDEQHHLQVEQQHFPVEQQHLPVEQQHFPVGEHQFPIDQQPDHEQQEELGAENRLRDEEQQKLQVDQQHSSNNQQHSTALQPAAGEEFEQCPPPFPQLDETLVHDNIDISRAGRKRKTVVEPAAAPMVKRGRGRPRKGEAKTAQLPPRPPAERPKRTQKGKATTSRRWQVVEDDPTGAEDASEEEAGGETDPDWE
ncbi:hypothetical protein CBR_g26507 [Chara braunii]|uniref:DUF659 domain-containing protein n=1 Tax=Chara braunii TaxID=69332 RepID=A0A388L851_CHABU|nr:hypothetical protein CBR_g26507 [Chara braunii]|eukprot:GBG78477.1 hypothetical protein CBR_g26507 [Chara braunii]